MSLWSLLFGNNIMHKKDNVTYIFSNSLKISQGKKFYLENLKIIFIKDLEEIYTSPWNDNDIILKEKVKDTLLSIVIYYADNSSQFYTSFDDLNFHLNLENAEKIHINFKKPLTRHEENKLYKLFT